VHTWNEPALLSANTQQQSTHERYCTGHNRVRNEKSDGTGDVGHALHTNGDREIEIG
jgi:hypothetical protein